MGTRNPSPPPDFSEDLHNVDNIGDTSYSKRWLFSLLLDLLSVMNSSSLNGEQVEDLDPDMEERLCCLWDLTVNRDILPHLDEFDIVPILADALTYSRHPRLLEISAGILANMAHSPTACQKMSDMESFIDRVLTLFSSRDTPTLTEVCRLMHTVLSSGDNGSAWLTSLKSQSEFFDNFLFILRSSTNDSLLIATIRLLDAITRGDDHFAEAWCGSDLLDSVLEAQHQMVWLHGSEVEVIHRLFYTFSSTVTGVGALNRSVLPCLMHITLGCHQQLRDCPLVRGVLADLNILFKDVIRSLDGLFHTLTNTLEDQNHTNWLSDLDRPPNAAQREAFISCLLNDGGSESRNQLLFVCTILKLPHLLETLDEIALRSWTDFPCVPLARAG
ncbi:unnamed protein product [Dicrocoelium dendriticum]|nr:unnamed protein product [Dicrocoelium dendriticum]